MKNSILRLTMVLTMALCQPLIAQYRIGAKPSQNYPDLKIRQFKFVPGSSQGLRVQVANYGQRQARPSLLRLTVRKINGVAVGRSTDVKLPSIAGGQGHWAAIDARTILPRSTALQDTTFRLDADATRVVRESNESNNVAWHNLKADSARDRPSRSGEPDLRVRHFEFVRGQPQGLRVQVANYGNGTAGACILNLTVRRINGVAVGRAMKVRIPAILAGKGHWTAIDASRLLPNNVTIRNTTFKLIIDATGLVDESDESNNEVWHNLR